MPALLLAMNSGLVVLAVIQGEAFVAACCGFIAGLNLAECVRAMRSQAR